MSGVRQLERTEIGDATSSFTTAAQLFVARGFLFRPPFLRIRRFFEPLGLSLICVANHDLLRGSVFWLGCCPYCIVMSLTPGVVRYHGIMHQRSS
ncbi:hypothetical protein BDN67DRAFT_351441 [Paxillus ammoniavirescens]|nr:hypothetical protein BDN67DRAFT_351441 [Paxillus ammoniavirescens]